MNSEIHLSKTSKGMEVGLRPASQEDIPFLFSSIMKSAICKHESKSNCLCSIAPRKQVIELIHSYLEQLLENSRIVMAVDPEDPNVIYSYVWIVDDSLLYVYTKDLFRSQGLATLLLSITFPNQYPKLHSLISSSGRKLLSNYSKQLSSK